jgi:hypothetical protein
VFEASQILPKLSLKPTKRRKKCVASKKNLHPSPPVAIALPLTNHQHGCLWGWYISGLEYVGTGQDVTAGNRGVNTRYVAADPIFFVVVKANSK